MKTVAGLDVHKDSVYLCILRENGEKIERVYGVLTPQLESMRDFMAENEVSEVPALVHGMPEASSLILIGIMNHSAYLHQIILVLLLYVWRN